MCGIVAYVGRSEAWPIIYEGLKRLEYRGYDSAGIAVVDDTGAMHLRKTVGKVSGLDSEVIGSAPRGSLGLGHTRWATHGAPSHANAHPHTDCSSRVALVHNGIVENYLELKRRLTESGHVFRSETDTEALSHLVEEGLSLGLSFEEAFRRMGRMVKGSSAITATLQGKRVQSVLCGWATPGASLWRTTRVRGSWQAICRRCCRCWSTARGRRELDSSRVEKWPWSAATGCSTSICWATR